MIEAAGSELAPGRVVGDYEVESKIAAGGFGVVYRARHNPSGELVALKVLHPELAKNLDACRRFEREVRLVNLIGHPNIVKILGVGALEDGVPFFTMELLEGEDLKSRIATRGRMSATEMVAIIEPLCAALAASHAKAVIHRDLKPSNVFLSDRVVLLDFGVAKLLEDTGAKITSSRHVIGSPPFMAPEQIIGGSLDERTDVYATGALAFFMLTAKMPFFHANLAVVQSMHLNQPAPPPSRFAPVNAAVDRVILRALAKRRGDRPRNSLYFAAALRSAVEGGGDPITTGVVSAIYAHLSIDPGVLEAQDDDELATVEAVLPTISERLESSGFEVASRTGNSLLVVATDVDLGAAAELARALDRDLKSPLHTLELHVRRGPRDELEPVAGWVPTDSDPGVHCH